MMFVSKSQPAPPCLAIEKAKKAGDYKCPNVLERIRDDFKNKCYICESKEPVTINVEHFRPHRNNIDLKFDWNNLFWSCSHCNNIKHDGYDDIINCSDPTHRVEERLEYFFNPFPFEDVNIVPLDDLPETLTTSTLLLNVYNGTTKLKMIESANLRNNLMKEIISFQTVLIDYFDDTNSPEARDYHLLKICNHIHRGSNFTAFKRWIILRNDRLRSEFEKYFN